MEEREERNFRLINVRRILAASEWHLWVGNVSYRERIKTFYYK